MACSSARRSTKKFGAEMAWLGAIGRYKDAARIVDMLVHRRGIGYHCDRGSRHRLDNIMIPISPIAKGRDERRRRLPQVPAVPYRRYSLRSKSHWLGRAPEHWPSSAQARAPASPDAQSKDVFGSLERTPASEVEKAVPVLRDGRIEAILGPSSRDKSREHCICVENLLRMAGFRQHPVNATQAAEGDFSGTAPDRGSASFPSLRRTSGGIRARCGGYPPHACGAAGDRSGSSESCRQRRWCRPPPQSHRRGFVRRASTRNYWIVQQAASRSLTRSRLKSRASARISYSVLGGQPEKASG